MKIAIAAFLSLGFLAVSISSRAADGYDVEGSGYNQRCDTCTTCTRYVEVDEPYSCTTTCNCQPNPGGTIHCDQCPATCTRKVKKAEAFECPAHTCNCRPGSSGH